MRNTTPILFFILLFVLSSCKPNLSSVATTNEQGVFQAIIEIPAGTNLKLEYSKDKKTIEPDQQNGQDRRIDFLPYPANYGFIPGTLMDKEDGGDGDPLDVFILSEQVPSGTVLPIQPIAVLNVKDEGALDTKIIAIPHDPKLRVMKAENFTDFMTEYHMAQQILQTWVLSYKGLGTTEFLGWEDEKAANKLIEKFRE